jgi:hypothetical protein
VDCGQKCAIERIDDAITADRMTKTWDLAGHDRSTPEFLGGNLHEKLVNEGPFFGEYTIDFPCAASKDFPEYDAVARNPQPAEPFQFSLQAFDIATIIGQRFDGSTKLAARLGSEGFNERNNLRRNLDTSLHPGRTRLAS